MQSDNQLRGFLFAIAFCLSTVGGAEAADLDAVGGLFLRLPFAADGSGPEQPRLGFGAGPNTLPGTAFSFEMDIRGQARLGLAGYDWFWQLPPPEMWGGDLQPAEQEAEELDGPGAKASAPAIAERPPSN